MARVLLVFVDGVGLGDDDAGTNPFLSAALPALRGLLGTSRLVRDRVPIHPARASLVGVDATLDTEGVPQSGTGQAALLTGLDAVALHGRHFGPWVPQALRPIVREQSVLRRAQQAGCAVAFANAYPEEVLSALHGDDAGLPSDNPRSSARRRSAAAFLRAGPPLAALGAGLLNRHTPDLVTGNAVASEITNEGWRERLGRTRVPVIDAVRAGRNLARIAQEHQLTLFAHYATDYAGHARDMDAAVLALERFDSFLGGLVDEAAADLLIVVVSDHGNIEDTTTGHTRNPALGLVIGNGHAPVARRLRRLTDVAPAVLDVLAL